MRRLIVAAAALAVAAPMAATAAPFTTIDGFNFDLGQFSTAFVTTDGTFASSNFDNVAGVDGFELGELAARPGGTTFPVDAGDRISLGDDTTEQFLKLDYGANGFSVGAGQASNFVVYESSGRDFVDPEGLNFKISFNGGAFVNAGDAGVASVVALAGAAEHNQIVFDLTDVEFGFLIGDTINTVEIRNLTGFPGTSDPDFTFAGRAGIDAAIPAPAALPLMLSVLALGGLMARRRKS